MPKIFLRVFAVITLALALLTGAAHALDKGAAAPEIALKTLSGQPIKLSALKGKVVLVDFWASWCAPCRESMPFLEKLSKSYKDQGLVVLGVNIDNDIDAARKFLKEMPVSFQVVNDAQKSVAKAYAPPTMPSSYIIDKRGVVHVVHAGFRRADAAKIEAEIKSLL